MRLLAVAAVAYAIGSLLGVVANATLNQSRPRGFDDLTHALEWFQFSGTFVAFVAICVAGQELLHRRKKTEAVEAGVAALGTLVWSLGALTQAGSWVSTAAAHAVGAVGIGIWALLAASRAARPWRPKQSAIGAPPSAGMWLAGSFGVALVAVGSGFNVKVTDQALGIAANLLQAIGLGLVAFAIGAAGSRAGTGNRRLATVIAGLVVLAAAFVETSVVAGVAFTPTGTLTELRIGAEVANVVICVGVILLGLAAWKRAVELAIPPLSSPHASKPSAPPPPSSASRPSVPIRQGSKVSEVVHLVEMDRHWVDGSYDVEGCLVLAGQDLNGSEYEWYFRIRPEHFPKIRNALGGKPDEDILGLLAARVDTLPNSGSRDPGAWLRDQGIPTEFFNWVS